MNEIWFLAGMVVILFCLLKFFEMKFVENELKPLKFFIRDAVFVLASALVASYCYFQWRTYIHDFFNVLINDKEKPIQLTEATIFTDLPGF